MTRHRSYGKSSNGAAKRSVLKRYERIDVLKQLGKLPQDNTQVLALPKTKSI